ncbi:cell division protein ZapE [Arsenophonus apicola]|uniref:Cell division protein ZapE n=1 Tax=Arsenophonus apicola TaxID=2879119 RepID=A0ABY8P195_9GAMM|nr:cell division protein ZapE [Arsenophonus apicola]WGO83267.1 cell division protein ZapE [Arsenophonus apicola]
MALLTPTKLYHQFLATGDYQFDEVQSTTIARLDIIHHQLLNRTSQLSLRNKIGQLFVKKSYKNCAPIQGLYMWGGVGRGKTWLMDLFYQSLPDGRKLRLHFHRFMWRVHNEMIELQGQQDPLEIIAERFKKQTDVLCFDEFFVSHITDAMILATLLKALFARGICLIATSNIPPDELYRNGLQRTRFLPAIEQIKKYCDIINVDAGIDYRLRTLKQADLYLTPIDEESCNRMDEIFIKLAGKPGDKFPILEINHRTMPAICAAEGILSIEFKALCEDARSQNDYIILAKDYHTVLLYNVLMMSEIHEDAARRFIALIDEFYERKVKLIINAEVAMDKLYQGHLLRFEYQRCLSRLQEMQSEEYLKLPHIA